jgi:hypothetical protein
MMRLDVEGLANTFKLFEGAPEQLDGKLSVIEERASLAAGSFPFSNFFRRRRRRRLSFVPASTAVGSSTPSPPSHGDRRFVVVNREEEEEVKKKMTTLWKKQGKAGEGDWVRELY